MIRYTLLLAFICLPYPVCWAQTWAFIPNQGQWHPKIQFQIGQSEERVILGQNEIWYDWREAEDHGHKEKLAAPRKGHRLRLRFLNAKMSVPQGDQLKQTRYHYFRGNDPNQWATDVPAYGACWYRNLYKGIDLKVSTRSSHLKMDWYVSAGADPAQIRMSWEGQDQISLSEERLLLETSLGTLTELAPFAYQVLDGKEQVVKCQFILKGKEVSFAFPEGYNPQLPLVIDPELVFSTYSGSTGDNWGLCATYDEQANAYLAGNMWVFATGYPVTPGAFQSTSFGG
ncbi:MAG: hypothetical protein AAF927_14600, partial [Bacteroidota bacterium]